MALTASEPGPDGPAKNELTDGDRCEVLVIGSGAGGSVTAATLAEQGYDVLLLEEGPRRDTSTMATHTPAALASLYRDAGLTPIFGNQTIAYVEGRCVGGSTEINSAFWHRLPPDCYHRWRSDAQVADLSPERLEPYFDRLERELSVSYLDPASIPRSSQLFRLGIERMGWDYMEVPRCQQRRDGSSPFAPGNKQSMQRTYLPRALAAGARLVADCKALRLRHDGTRATGALLRYGSQRIEVRADHVFVCGGAVQTAALLRRSGITKNIGDNLRIHPMIKAAARFDEPLSANDEVLPIYQVKEFWPNISIGGSVFTPGFLALLLSDNWDTQDDVMQQWDHMALYYAATRGMNRGTVRPVPGSEDGTMVRYRLSAGDQRNISDGLSYLGELLFAAGAREVYPSLRSHPRFRSAQECRGLRRQPVDCAAMSLSTVHAFSSCPMGENPDLSATDSYGLVRGFGNLYINDASLLPDSPGVNPQGTIMAIALRNAEHFTGERHARRRLRSAPPPSVLITGAPGWLGNRLVETLAHGLEGIAGFGPDDPRRRVRCLIHPATSPADLGEFPLDLELVAGDLTDPEAARALCGGAEGAVLFHIAGVVHPRRSTAEFTAANVTGTRNLLAAAVDAKVRRVVAVSSNSPFGFNPHRDHQFDEQSPYNPYMGYGRSKREMELLVREAHARGAIETVIVRPPWFYGPHQPPRQTLFFQMIKEGRFPILGDGEQRRSMGYVDNLCQGLLLAATVEHAAGETYWIADERPYSINEIVATVAEVLERELGVVCAPPRLRLPAVLGRVARVVDGAIQGIGRYHQKVHVLSEMAESIACSIDKAKTELGYRPRYALREGMVESVRWCVANGMRL